MLSKGTSASDRYMNMIRIISFQVFIKAALGGEWGPTSTCTAPALAAPARTQAATGMAPLRGCLLGCSCLPTYVSTFLLHQLQVPGGGLSQLHLSKSMRLQILFDAISDP